MIKNDTQYRITEANIKVFSKALADIKSQPVPSGVDSRLPEIQRRALESQIEEMTFDLNEYETLKTGKVTIFEAESLSELPTLFVKARIARGFNYKDLAKRLKVEEQQVQRWEDNDYYDADIETLKSLVHVLDIGINQEMFVFASQLTSSKLLALLTKAGIPSDFVLKRLVTHRIASFIKDETIGLVEIAGMVQDISRIYGLKVIDLIKMKSPKIDFSAIGAMQFKLPVRANKRLVNAYAIYAHYLSAILTDCVESKSTAILKKSFHEFHQVVTTKTKPLTFERVVRFLWSCGIIVIPICDSGGFHGAVWKIKGRFVIALKQKTELESRWLYDAIHEVGHIVNGDITDDMSLIEEYEISPATKGEAEEKANEWAENVIFDGRSEKIEEECTQACNGNLQKLKGVIPGIAEKYNVNIGSLANHMAFRLAEQGENWWGAANNLQIANRSPFSIARECLLENAKLYRLSKYDREVVLNALLEE